MGMHKKLIMLTKRETWHLKQRKFRKDAEQINTSQVCMKILYARAVEYGKESLLAVEMALKRG